jgi:hypothetical protein
MGEMDDVNELNIVDDNVQDAGKFFVYELFIALAGVIGILIIVALGVWIIRQFNLGGLFKR